MFLPTYTIISNWNQKVGQEERLMDNCIQEVLGWSFVRDFSRNSDWTNNKTESPGLNGINKSLYKIGMTNPISESKNGNLDSMKLFEE